MVDHTPPPEVPVLEEHHGDEAQAEQPADDTHTPQPAVLAQALSELPALQLRPPVSAAAPDPPRRWSLDGSLHSGSWELLSALDGQHSHCGSSPRSLSGYDSEAEAAGEGPEACTPRAAPPPRPTAAERQAAPAPEPFGSLVLPAAGQAGVGSLQAAALAAAAAAAAASAASSPRSSYDHPSTHASRADLYSLSQDDPDHLSDHDSYIDDMMIAGEPEPELELGADLGAGHGDGGGAPPPKAAPPSAAALALAPAAAVAAAARGAYCAASSHLRALVASFSALLAHVVPAGAQAAQRAMAGMAGLVGCLRERIAPLGLTPLAASAAAVRERTAAAAAGGWRSAQQQYRAASGQYKQLRYANVNWKKAALALTGVCGVLAALLYRSYWEQARLAAALAKREGELARVLARVMDLQRSITTHRSVPLVRHVAMPAPNTTATLLGPAWPAVIVV